MKSIFENETATERFSLNNVYLVIFEKEKEKYLKDELKTKIDNIIKTIGDAPAKRVLLGILRFSFFIEPVKKPKIETTKFAVRWTTELNGDPRYASYENCYDIFINLIDELEPALNIDENKSLIEGFSKYQKVSYEMPIDYKDRKTTPIHKKENIEWIWSNLPHEILKLRMYLTDNTKHKYANVFSGVYDKIQVKTYLTDRVLTGAHKTNREKRWECHPNSVHFALRKTAWEIEYELMKQVCHFQAFPTDLKELLIKDNVISFNTEIVKCPITFEPLSYTNLNAEIQQKIHGKSNFQVGHINPLKADSDDEISGHTASNISWISEQGNRIQGSNSVTFIRELIIKIYKNYLKAGITGL
jgi:hypothetical protein